MALLGRVMLAWGVILLSKKLPESLRIKALVEDSMLLPTWNEVDPLNYDYFLMKLGWWQFQTLLEESRPSIEE